VRSNEKEMQTANFSKFSKKGVVPGENGKTEIGVVTVRKCHHRHNKLGIRKKSVKRSCRWYGRC